MKFSFINPGPNLELKPSEKKMIGSAPPLGLLYIATVLRDEGFEVSLLDHAAESISIKEAADWVKRENPDILGISTIITSGRTAARIAREAKQENPDLTVVFGNFHATFNAERILKKYPWVDLIVRGEGEHTCLELAGCLQKGGRIKDVFGITFRKGSRVVSTPERPLIRDVDALPFPDRDLLDGEYHNTTVGVNVAPKKFTTVLSSRGCVYRCRFCGCQRFARGRWRPRSVDNILEELHLLAEKGYRQFMFVDDNFTVNQRRVIQLCKRMRREELDIEWICEGRVDVCSYELMREIAEAGCRLIYFGIESANQRVLDYYRKQITPEQSKTAVETARKAGIEVIMGSFIVGAPHETRQEIQNTLAFAQNLDLDIPQFNILGAFPGMDIWDELRAEGLIEEDRYWETGVQVAEVHPDTVPCEEIMEMVNRHFKHFFLRPDYILREVVRIMKSTYRMTVAVNSLTRLEIIADSIRHLAH